MTPLRAVLPQSPEAPGGDRARQLTLRGTTACWLILTLVVAGLACSDENPQPTPTPVLRGLADFHSHQFAHLGFGRKLHSHPTDPATRCRPPLDFTVSTFRVEDLVREGLFGDAAAQGSQCYPTESNLAGQQMDDNSLKRAWKYGLRLLVVFAVNSEFLCEVANLAPSDLCNDRDAIEDQLRAARQMEARLDHEAGGEGQGWYQVVLTPSEARDVISQGKLAVVLGVESVNAFGCDIVMTGFVAGVPNLAGHREPERKFALGCNPPLNVKGSTTPRALALMEQYWDLGARHFYPVHNSNGIAGGTAISIPLLHANTNPSRLLPGYPFDKVAEIDRVIAAIRPHVTAFSCGFEFDGGRCNESGLSPTGLALARIMASYGAMIDIDHLSLKAKRDLRGDDGLGPQYPVVSSHSGFAALNHRDKSNEGQLTENDISVMTKWDGAFGPILRGANTVAEEDTFPPGASIAPHNCGGTTETFIQAYRYAVSRLQGGERVDGSKPFPGVGFGSDFNGLASWPAPRFARPSLPPIDYSLKSAFVGGDVEPPPGRCYGRLLPSSEPRVIYPFESPMTGETIPASVLPWSGRADLYNVGYDGVAHIGMIPDMVEEMRVLGLTDADLEPLWHGAEAYLRTWEAAQEWASSYTDEVRRGIRAQCRLDRAELLVLPTEWTSEEVRRSEDRWRRALERLKTAGCYLGPTDGPDPEPTPIPTTPTTPSPPVTVPFVEGESGALASNAIRAAGLVPRLVGTGRWVVSQSPRGGAEVPPGTTVTCQLGQSP
jgi:microsomal dipeptidase-like Zn-dependent dipeptidase